MSTTPLGFLPPLDEIAYAVNLAEGRPSHPFERILQSIPESQRRLAAIDDRAAGHVLSAYDGAREDIVGRMDRRWERVLAESGGRPSEGQLYSFAHDTELLQSLEARQLEVTDRVISVVEGAHESAIKEAMRHAGFERSQIARGLDPQARMSIAGSFAPPPGVAEEIGIPRAVARIRAAGGELSEKATETLARAAMAGEGVGPMKSRLRKEFDLTARSAELTSRYVTISSYNYAREMHYIGLSDQLAQYGRKLQKMWLTSVDDRACPICLALHGQVVDTEVSFPLDATYGTTPPGKPYPDPDSCEAPPRHARCRCSVTSWVEGWRDGTSRTPEALQEEAREWAEQAGLNPSATPPVTGEKRPRGPSPFGRTPRSPRHIDGSDLRQVDNVDFDRSLGVYRSCSLPDPAPAPAAPVSFAAKIPPPPATRPHVSIAAIESQVPLMQERLAREWRFYDGAPQTDVMWSNAFDGMDALRGATSNIRKGVAATEGLDLELFTKKQQWNYYDDTIPTLTTDEVHTALDAAARDLLTRVPEELPKSVYRGMHVPESMTWEPGESIDLNFSSFASKPSSAVPYMQRFEKTAKFEGAGKGVLFEMQDAQGLPIKPVDGWDEYLVSGKAEVVEVLGTFSDPHYGEYTKVLVRHVR